MSTKKDVSVVLFSGGLDSTLMLHERLKEGDFVYVLTFNYGQKNHLELQASFNVLEWFGERFPSQGFHSIVPLPGDQLFGRHSALMAAGEDLDRTPYEEVKERAPQDGPLSSFVPYRNGVFISMATALALRAKAQAVYIGITGEGARDYPDCTYDFIVAQRQAVRAGTDGKVRLYAPFAELTKQQIVEWALNSGAPIHLTRSCYDSTPQPCGTCLACQERAAAFETLGVPDPAA